MSNQYLIQTLTAALSRRKFLQAAAIGATASALAACVLLPVAPAVNQSNSATNIATKPGDIMPEPICIAPNATPEIPLFPGITV